MAPLTLQLRMILPKQLSPQQVVGCQLLPLQVCILEVVRDLRAQS